MKTSTKLECHLKIMIYYWPRPKTPDHLLIGDSMMTMITHCEPCSLLTHSSLVESRGKRRGLLGCEDLLWVYNYKSKLRNMTNSP